MFLHRILCVLEIPGRIYSPLTVVAIEGADAGGSEMGGKLFIAYVCTAG